MGDYKALELEKVKSVIASYCAFSLGQRTILSAEPVFNQFIINSELKRTKEALNLVWKYGAPPFQGVHDHEESIQNALKDRILSPKELRQIADSERAILRMQNYFKENEIETPYLQEYIDSFMMDLQLASAIEKCISQNDEVLDNASSALKDVRKNIRSCEGDISKEVQRFISRNGSKLMDTITTTRNDRICVLVKISEKNSVNGFIHGESASGQTAYIEPESLLQLNNRLQSLRSKEGSEVERILFELSQLVKADGPALLANLETFTLLDATFAKALWCKDIDGCVAHLDLDGTRLYLKDARHPLIDQKVVFANTYEIAAPYRTLLITGSNTGGKTVTLKTMGLFVALTMCGMPVSAQEANIPYFDQLFIDIGDDQSIQESLSTFSSHISKLAYICDHATSKSFILLDELGSGTDPREGEALAVAILEYLRTTQAMVIATTHYSELKNYGAICEDILLSSVAFDIDIMKPTYRYIEGVSGSSYAFEIASRYHLRNSIITSARTFKEERKNELDKALETMERTILENRTLKEEMEVRLLDIKNLQKNLEKQKEIIKNERARMLVQAKEDSDAIVHQTKEQAEEIIEQLKQLTADAKPHEHIQLKKRLDDLQLDEEHETSVEESFAVGDYVQLKKHNYFGEILSMKKDQVCVLVHGMKMNVALKDITHAKKQVKKKAEKSYSKAINSTFSMELNVIGMTVNEALPVIDKYLDNAIIAKVYQVRIIHGNGTGALRKGVHQFLKRHVRVEEFRMGGQGEGGLGATVVSLKHKVKNHG